MRKADYQTLAGVLRAAMIRNANPSKDTSELARQNDIRRAEVERIATRLSEQLSVAPADFLKACGIEP